MDESRRADRAPRASRGGKARVRQLVTQLEKSAAAARRARAAARRGDEDAVMVAIGESESADAQAQHIARDLGAATCAEP